MQIHLPVRVTHTLSLTHGVILIQTISKRGSKESKSENFWPARRWRGLKPRQQRVVRKSYMS